MRDADENRITTLFSEAYAQDKLFATKIIFYARDIRCGLGERKTFRTIIRYMAEHHPESLRPNLDLIGVFGRYDDLYELIGTPLEDDMWKTMKNQFEEDLKNLNEGKAISLLAKWIKTADASSAKTRKLGILTAQKLDYPVYNFKRIVRSMRKQIGVVESLMSAGKWNEIKYPEVPSRAMMIYRRAFAKHDPDGFSEFINKADKGEVKINGYTIRTYDNYGEKVMTTVGDKINVKGNPVETTSYDSDGSVITGYEMSSVITINIDGKEIQSCGDTCIFEQDGLEPDVDFEQADIYSQSTGKIDENTYIAGIVNQYKNDFGKSRVVVIKSQLGQPITAYSGDEV